MSEQLIKELKEKISDLTVENERIKKTSKSRFDQIARLKLDQKNGDILKSRFKVLRDFLIRREIEIDFYECSERVDFALMRTIRGLEALEKKKDEVSVSGIYSVLIDGNYSTVKIIRNICWAVSFEKENGKYVNYIGLHRFNISEFILHKAEL